MNSIFLILIIVCVILSSFFSGVEMALAKVNKTRLEREAEKGDKSAKLTLSFANNYNDTINVILIGNNLVNIAATSLATLLFQSLIPGDVNTAELTATLVMTVVILTFGEILPKSICSSYAFGLSKVLSKPLYLFKVIFTPITFVVKKILNGFTNLIDKKKGDEHDVTDEELIEMVDTLEEQGLINEETQELITNAIDFMDVDAVEVMVHRTDFFAYDINDDINELINHPDLLNYSRIPVYDENVDNIIGILNTKKLIKLHLNGDEINVKDLLTEPLYVFQTQSISDILKRLRHEHIHMAIVKDEFGGTSGLLTMEDILEELVGEIYDEIDEEENDEYHKVNDKKFTVDGDMNLYDFFDLIEYDYEEFESMYTTVGGWITDVLEKFPEEKDSFEFEGYLITVMRASQFTVDRVSVLRLEEDEEESEN